MVKPYEGRLTQEIAKFFNLQDKSVHFKSYKMWTGHPCGICGEFFCTNNTSTSHSKGQCWVCSFCRVEIIWTVSWMKVKALLPVELRPLLLRLPTAAPASRKGKTAQPATAIRTVSACPVPPKQSCQIIADHKLSEKFGLLLQKQVHFRMKRSPRC